MKNKKKIKDQKITKEYLKKLKKSPEPKEYKRFNKKQPVTNRIKDWFKIKFKSDTVVGVNMELNNGDFKTMIVCDNHGTFKYNGGLYVFDDSLKYYNMSMKLYCYDFHEGFTLPLKRKIPLNDLRESCESIPEIEIEYVLNPKVAHRFAQTKVIEGVMAGSQLPEMLKKIFMVGIIGMLFSVGMVVLFVFKTGMLESVTGTLGL